MKRLLNSSSFWNAFIGSALLFLSCMLPGCSDIAQYIFFLFAGKTAVTGLKDFTRAQKGVIYDEKEKGFKKI
jgi:hypothetical protein